MSDTEIQIFELPEGLQEAASRHVAAALEPSAQGQIVRIALSGGSTPRRFHELLAQTPGIDWSNVHVYWGDERPVPPDSDESNYRMAHETLLSKVEIPRENIHRMRGEINPRSAAREYERRLQETFGVEPPAVPAFDVMVLGVGSDGHTASLFPRTEALNERERWVVANHVPQHDTWRVTLTYPVLNASKLAVFLVAGRDKADALRSTFSTDDQGKPPAAFVQPQGKVIWFLDKTAADLLPRS